MFPSYYLKSCASTNDEILHVLKEKPQNSAVYTFNQTKGRGQYGNVWESSEDLNIAYSLALKATDFRISDILFNFCTANVLRDFLAKLTKREVKIKWPNDIIIQGKKVSGMLIEKQKINGEEFYIIGIGINVLQEEFPGISKAGSLYTQSKKKFDLNDLFVELNSFFFKNIQKHCSEEEILEKFNENLFRKDLISVFEIKGLRQNGIIKTADKEGFLWIDLENNGLKKFYHKEIELLY